MALFNYDLKITQGATFSKQFVFKAGNQVVDLSGYTGAAQIRSTYSAPQPIHEMNTESGGMSIDGPNGLITLSIPPSITKNFNFNTYPAVYDVELYSSADPEQITSLVGGLVKLTLEVTRP